MEPKKKSKLSDSEEEYKPEAETTSSKPAARGRKVAAKRPSKRKKLNSDEAGEAIVEAKAEEAQHQGPSKMNLFALGFEETIDGGPTSVKTFMTPEQRLAHNASTGKANENYKKIDLKKKSYSKGKTGGKFIKNMEYKRKLAAKVRLIFSLYFFLFVTILKRFFSFAKAKIISLKFVQLL